jgi:hypothetical protein
LKQAYASFQRQKQQKAEATIDAVAGMLLDLGLQCYGPINDPLLNANNTSQAMALSWYAERNPEFNALLHICGLGAELKLPAAQPKDLKRWAKTAAGL